jgi:preprotein translocase SecE subunit
LQVRILPDPLKTKPLYEWNKWYLVVVLAMKEWVVTLRSFLQEAWAEFQRVQWPSRKEVRAATIVVIFLVTIIALYLFLVDWMLSWLLQAILRS